MNEFGIIGSIVGFVIFVVIMITDVETPVPQGTCVEVTQYTDIESLTQAVLDQDRWARDH
jgi:hypothetical protein